MKRTLRFAAVCLIICLLCGCLCGCSLDVDELRTRHGRLTAEDNIVLNGVTYRPLPITAALSPSMDTETWIFVAEENVPLLFAMNEGDDYYMSEDGVFLREEYGGYPDDKYYCRSERYDEVMAQLNDPPELTRYQYTYSTVDDDDQINTAVYELTPAQTDTYIDIWNTAKWGAVSTDNTPFYGSETVALTRVSENRWFSAPEVTIYCPDNEYGSYAFLKEDTAYFSFYATIDSAWNDELQAILKPFLDGEEQVQALYESWD